jgi:LPXTG-site transpeptidase (sortase) family protein
VTERPVPHTSHRRRLFRCVLVLAGIGLLAVGSAFGLERGPRHLNLRAQKERLLPPPAVDIVPKLVKPAVELARAAPPERKQEPRPVRISIPAIGASAPLVPLGLNSDHTVQVPKSFSDAGWFTRGPRPGETGAALIIGHVDSKSGPGVFFHLPALERGDEILVRLADNRTLRFAVTSSRDVSKHRFPSQLIFAHTSRPTLRLVTCGGRFDASTGHYVDNHIVFAWLIGRQ